MKVLLVSPILGPGGAERVVADLACNLSSFGAEAKVCYFDGRRHLQPVIEAEGIEVLFLNLPHKAYPTVGRLRTVLRKWAPDIIHAHMPRAAFWCAMANSKGLVNSPLIYTEHQIQEAYPSWVSLLYRYFLPRVCHVVSVSRAVQNSISERFHYPSASMSVIWNGIVQAHVRDLPSHEAMRRALEADPDTFIIANVGNLRPRKGHDVLIKAIALVIRQIPDTACWIIGNPEADPCTTTSLRQLITTLGLERQVRLLGYRSDVASLLAASDLVVLSSRQEGFPLTILEAMAIGKPVVATDVGGCREAVIAGETGLIVPPDDPQALANGIVHVLIHRDDAQRIGMAARRRFEKHFTVTAMTRKHYELYRRILRNLD